MSSLVTGYRCIACEKQLAADHDAFTCPDCGGNLEVVYDYAIAARVMGGGLMGRDMFRYRALLPAEPPREGFPVSGADSPSCGLCCCERV